MDAEWSLLVVASSAIFFCGGGGGDILASPLNGSLPRVSIPVAAKISI